MSPAAPSRRRLLAAGAASLTTGIAVPVLGRAADPAEALGPARAAAYRPRRYRRTSVPTPLQRHYMNRLGCGQSRATYRELLRAGSAHGWFERQLTPSAIAESVTARALSSWFPELDEDPRTKWAKQENGTKGGWEYAADLAGYSMLRQVYSHRQVFENMVGFWSDLLHVHADTDLGWVHRFGYDETIREHALGRFDDLLVATALHPAMLLYLDNWTSRRGAPNENQGRELLELHTVGRAAGYTEAMVKDSAKILSGWTVDAFGSWAGSYDAQRHTTGPVQVLAFTADNASSDGRQLTVDYLRYLAQHPATALNIARRLCRHLVADAPSTALVTAVARTFRDSGTDIAATLRTLVAHPDFAASKGRLVRNPVQDLVATCRVLGVAVHRPTGDRSFARACIWLPQTVLLYQWPRPDGLPLGNQTWSSATRMLSSFRMHWELAAGWWPTEGVTYRKHGAAWMPQRSLHLDAYVDHLCRLVLGTVSDRRILSAVVAATGYPPRTVVTRRHAINTWQLVRVLGVLLDSPDHMCR